MKIEQFDLQRHKDDVLKLFKTSLNNIGGEDWFQWKHMDNPFGVSYGFVAIENEQIIGARFFMQWEFLSGGEVLKAIRPVDTVTHPSSRGKGVFTKLTLHGLDKLNSAAYSLIFNTPNNSSLPGYLKMGWKLYPYAFKHMYFFASPFSHRRTVEIESSVSKEFVPGHIPEGVESHKSAEFIIWRYGAGNYQFAKFSNDQSALLVFKTIKRKGISIMLIKDYIGDPVLKKSLILSTAKRLSILICHTIYSPFVKNEFGFFFLKGSSNVVLNAPDDIFQLKFFFSPGDLEGII